MKPILNQIFLLAATLFYTVHSNAQLLTYDAPGGLKYTAHNDDYTVKVRQPGGQWMDLFEYNVQVDLDNVQNASMVSFDFSGKVEISVRKNNGKISLAQIRPLSYKMIPKIEENLMSFEIDKPCKISLEVDGDKLHNLHVFANQIVKDKPDPKDPNVIYFGPGIHQPKDLPGDVFHIPSGKTVYIDGGAVIKAKLLIDHAQDVKIIGTGIVFQPERGIEVRHSKNIIIDGPTFINPSHYTIYGGQTSNLTIRNIKSFSCKGWSDGIDLMSCSDVLIDDVFMRNSDDCIAIYGHRWEFYGDAKNYLIKNSILWADIAHPTNIGLHGNTEAGGDVIENITFSNIDILEHDEDDLNYQGCLAISASDNNLVRNITYENIRIEDFQEGQLFNFRVYFNEKYSGAPGKAIKNITLKNIQYNGNSANASVIRGYDKERILDGITIEGLKINRKTIQNAATDIIQIGDFTQNIKFINN